MPENAVAENVLGTIGTILWTIQLVPQIWKSYRTKSTKGLSHWLVFLWGLAGAFLGVYVIVQDLNIPLIIQPQLFGSLCLISWAQCQYYGNKRSLSTCIIMLVVLLLVLGGFEAGMVFAVRPSFRAGKLGPTQAFGILSSIFISGALLPQYWEIYKHGEVIGISITFMLVDCLGGVFSDLSLAFKPTFDVIAGVAYTLVVVLDGIVIILALFLNPRAKRRRELEAAEAAATLNADNHNHREPGSGEEESETPEDTASAIVTMTEEGPHPPPSLAITPRTRSRLSSSGARSMDPTAYTSSTPLSEEEKEKRTLQPDVKEVERGLEDFPPSPV